MCVRRNVQHRKLKLSKSTRFALVTVVMVAVPTGCVVSPPPLFSQNIQSHEKSPTSHNRAQGVPPAVSLVLGANRKGKGRVKGKASRIQSSRIGSALVCTTQFWSVLFQYRSRVFSVCTYEAKFLGMFSEWRYKVE